jgi:hypothetical protein
MDSPDSSSPFPPPKLNESSRSALLNELLRPLPQAPVVLSPSTATTAPWGMVLPPSLIPISIQHNHDFVRQILDNFTNFCEQNHQLGNNPIYLCSIQAARLTCGGSSIECEAETNLLLSGFIFRHVRQSLIDLEQNRHIRYKPQSYEPVFGTRASYIWEDDRGARVVWQSKSPFAGDQFFRAMDQMAQKGTRFEVNLEELTFYGAESVVVKVRSLFLFCNRRYKLTGFFRPR